MVCHREVWGHDNTVKVRRKICSIYYVTHLYASFSNIKGHTCTYSNVSD